MSLFQSDMVESAGGGAQMVPPNSRTHAFNHPTPDLGSKYHDKLFFGGAGLESQKQ